MNAVAASEGATRQSATGLIVTGTTPAAARTGNAPVLDRLDGIPNFIHARRTINRLSSIRFCSDHHSETLNDPAVVRLGGRRQPDSAQQKSLPGDPP
jgi:hypothetical protein